MASINAGLTLATSTHAPLLPKYQLIDLASEASPLARHQDRLHSLGTEAAMLRDQLHASRRRDGGIRTPDPLLPKQVR